MGIKERKERARQEMKELILETAKELFLKEGFKNVSIRRIAELMEYSPATIYLYFKDKNEMLLALQNEGFEKLLQYQKPLAAIRDPWEKLHKHAQVYISFALENPEYYDLMFIMRGPAEKIAEMKKWDAGIRSLQVLRDNVLACMETGQMKRKDADSTVFALWALVHGIASLIIRKRMIPLSASKSEVRALAYKAIGAMFKIKG